MSVHSGQSVTVEFTTARFDTGAATNADSTPTGTLVVNGTDNGASVTVTNVDTGRYKAAVTLPTLAVGDVVELSIAATVNSVAGKAIVWRDTKDMAVDSSGKVPATLAASDVSGNVPADVQTIKTQTVTCAAAVTVLASVGTAATSTAQTGDNFARLGAPAGASIAADIAGVMTKQMTEAYNADGVAPTPAQALFVIMQRLTEFTISGASLSVLKLDGSTPAYTLTLNSAVSPTASARTS